MTCLLLCLLCIFKFQTLTCQNFWIFYFTSRLTLYECFVNICIQRWFLIRNWTISKFYFLCSLSFTDIFMKLVLSFKFHIRLDFNFLFFFFYSVCRRRLDLAFLIDGSGSIETSGRGNFQRCIEFVKTVVSSFSISPSRTRVGVALFSSRAWLILNFYHSTSKAKVLYTISRIRYPHGGTRIGKALYFVLNRLFRWSRRALKVKLYKGMRL